MVCEISSEKTFQVHPEAFFLRQYQWEGMITLRFESESHSKDTGKGSDDRNNFVKAFMNDLRKKWKVRENQIRWVSSTEYGESAKAHCHIIFNFHPLTSRGIQPPCLKSLSEEIKESVERICEIKFMDENSVEPHFAAANDSVGLVNYALKVEPSRKGFDKEILWSAEPGLWIKALERCGEAEKHST